MKYVLIVIALLGFLGCASKPYDYTKYREHKPRSILVLPPINNATDIRGTYGYMSTVTFPIAEKGYYVFPVAVVDQMMKENGLPAAYEMHQVPLRKISEIINPDAVLYLTVQEYGTTYMVIDSQTRVSVQGKLVDAKTGTTLWEGMSTAVKSSGNSDHGLAAALITAVVAQAVNSTADYAHDVSHEANAYLFASDSRGLLNGPYHPKKAY